MQILYLGRAPRTKETLSDFLKWLRVTRHPLVFLGLTGSQRTPGFWGVKKYLLYVFSVFVYLPITNFSYAVGWPVGGLGIPCDFNIVDCIGHFMRRAR